MATNQELERLLRLLIEQGIQVLPYKGVLFIAELYKNKQLRETHDLDLLVHPKDAKKALEILLEDGYVFDIKNSGQYTQQQIINSVLDNQGFMEVEVPVLELVTGGADATPFVTHHNDFGTDMYLRISPETSLKKINLGEFIREVTRKIRESSGEPERVIDFEKIELCISWEQHSCFGYDLYDSTDYGIKVTAKEICERS